MGNYRRARNLLDELLPACQEVQGTEYSVLPSCTIWPISSASPTPSHELVTCVRHLGARAVVAAHPSGRRGGGGSGWSRTYCRRTDRVAPASAHRWRRPPTTPAPVAEPLRQSRGDGGLAVAAVATQDDRPATVADEPFEPVDRRLTPANGVPRVVGDRECAQTRRRRSGVTRLCRESHWRVQRVTLRAARRGDRDALGSVKASGWP